MAHYLYQRKDDGVYYAAYTDASGRLHRVSTGTVDKEQAQRFLDEKVARVKHGLPVAPRFDKVTWEEVRDDLVRHYKTTGEREEREYQKRIVYHLDPFFKAMKVARIEGDVITRYVERRQGEGAANGTINRELDLLRKALRLAVENRKLAVAPKVRALKEAAPRSGFVEHEQYEAIRRHLPEFLRPALTILYTFGWRSGEVLGLERRHLDLKARTLRLDPGTTKNGEGRVVHLTGELVEMLAAHIARLDAEDHEAGRIEPRLFRVNRLENFWETACKRAGIAGRIPHDLRRTAVRNLERGGVPRSVAMKITGHKSETVYRRYAIVSESDLAAATERIASLHTSLHSAKRASQSRALGLH